MSHTKEPDAMIADIWRETATEAIAKLWEVRQLLNSHHASVFGEEIGEIVKLTAKLKQKRALLDEGA